MTRTLRQFSKPKSGSVTNASARIDRLACSAIKSKLIPWYLEDLFSVGTADDLTGEFGCIMVQPEESDAAARDSE